MPNIPHIIQTEDRRYARDTSSMGLVATDRSALQRHRAQRAKSVHYAQLQLEIVDIKHELRELTTLVHRLLST